MAGKKYFKEMMKTDKNCKLCLCFGPTIFLYLYIVLLTYININTQAVKHYPKLV